MAFAEDLDPYFDTADGFAVAAVFNGSITVNCLFENAYSDALGAAGTVPLLTGPTAELATIDRGDAVVISAVSYIVQNIEADGTGVSLLRIERA